jgi:hypothetical protein
MDSIRASEAPDAGSIPAEATELDFLKITSKFPVSFCSKTSFWLASTNGSFGYFRILL